MNSNFGLLRTAPHRTASIRLIQVFFKDSGIAQSTVDSWKFAIDDGLKSVCVFLDLRKACGVIKHDILLAKLESYGIKGNALQWVNSYLLGRSQFVVCSDSGSELRHLPFGVPQGSVLGPTLFNIHINNVSKACHNSDVALFAGNTANTNSQEQRIGTSYLMNYGLMA